MKILLLADMATVTFALVLLTTALIVASTLIFYFKPNITIPGGFQPSHKEHERIREENKRRRVWRRWALRFALASAFATGISGFLQWYLR